MKGDNLNVSVSDVVQKQIPLIFRHKRRLKISPSWRVVGLGPEVVFYTRPLPSVFEEREDLVE